MTISGTNLGVTVNDVSVLIGTIECPLLQTRYKPGLIVQRSLYNQLDSQLTAFSDIKIKAKRLSALQTDLHQKGK